MTRTLENHRKVVMAPRDRLKSSFMILYAPFVRALTIKSVFRISVPWLNKLEVLKDDL